jgi:hypothetical protein
MRGTRAFWGGLRLHLLWRYFAAVKDAFWEILWGAGLIGMVFTFITLYWSPSVTALLICCLFAVFLSGYQVWRVSYQQLIPKLELLDVRTHTTATTQIMIRRLFVQLGVHANTQTPLEECRGQLLSVEQRTSDGDWVPTSCDEVLDLNWSVLDAPVIDLDVERRLNVCYRDSHQPRQIEICTDVIPIRMRLRVNPPSVLRFNLRVSAKNSVAQYKSVEVAIGENWDDVTATGGLNREAITPAVPQRPTPAPQSPPPSQA